MEQSRNLVIGLEFENLSRLMLKSIAAWCFMMCYIWKKHFSNVKVVSTEIYFNNSYFHPEIRKVLILTVFKINLQVYVT